MSDREIDMLREYLGREIGGLREELRDFRVISSREHDVVTAAIQHLTERVDALEDLDHVEAGRREFRRSLMRGLLVTQSVVVATGGLLVAVITHVAG